MSLLHFVYIGETDLLNTVVSEKNGAFIREVIMERYIDFRNNQTTENQKLCWKQKFLRISSSLQWSLFESSRIIIIEVRRFCNSMS